ncbi:hypothetical protein D3C71_1169430 [compost metagenome]
MYLVEKDNYAGFISYNDDPEAVYLCLKFAKVNKGVSNAPTPSLVFKKRYGAIKNTMVSIDEKINGEWKLKEGYEKKFEYFVKKRPTPTEKQVKISNTVAIAAFLRDLFAPVLPKERMN